MWSEERIVVADLTQRRPAICARRQATSSIRAVSLSLNHLIFLFFVLSFSVGPRNSTHGMNNIDGRRISKN